MKRTIVLLGTLLLTYACATEPRMSPAERLELYRANAGDPIGSFRLTGPVWGWRALGNNALTVWPRTNEGFLIELAGPCIDLSSAVSIELTSRVNRVSTFDSVIPRSHSFSPSRRPPCRIRSIRPINTQVIVEEKRDMGDVEMIARDPSEPSDSEEGNNQ